MFLLSHFGLVVIIIQSELQTDNFINHVLSLACVAFVFIIKEVFVMSFPRGNKSDKTVASYVCIYTLCVLIISSLIPSK